MMHGDDMSKGKTPSKFGDHESHRSKDLMSVAHSNRSAIKSRATSIAGSSLHSRVASQVVKADAHDEIRSRVSKSSYKNLEP